MLYADDAGIVSRSSEGLERTMTVIVTACSAFGPTVCEAKTEYCACRLKVAGRCPLPSMQPARYTNKLSSMCTWAGLSAHTELSIEVTRHLQRAWACFQRYKMEIYDRPGVRLRLKVRLLKAEVVETLLYGARRGARTSLIMTRYDGFTTSYSCDASDGGNGSVTTTPYCTPTHLPRQLPRA